MAFGPYQHVGFAYQGIGETAYQIGVIGGGTLLCSAFDITGEGTVTGSVSPVTRISRLELEREPITHRR